MRVVRLQAATNDIVSLDAKHPTVWAGVESFERLLAGNLMSGHNLYPGLGLKRDVSSAAIWKARVLCKNMGGKRSGLRYIYERVTFDGEDLAIALYVYLHSDGATKESQIQQRIKQRFAQVELTPEGFRHLEQADTAK